MACCSGSANFLGNPNTLESCCVGAQVARGLQTLGTMRDCLTVAYTGQDSVKVSCCIDNWTRHRAGGSGRRSESIAAIHVPRVLWLSAAFCTDLVPQGFQSLAPCSGRVQRNQAGHQYD